MPTFSSVSRHFIAPTPSRALRPDSATMAGREAAPGVAAKVVVARCSARINLGRVAATGPTREPAAAGAAEVAAFPGRVLAVIRRPMVMAVPDLEVPPPTEDMLMELAPEEAAVDVRCFNGAVIPTATITATRDDPVRARPASMDAWETVAPTAP